VTGPVVPPWQALEALGVTADVSADELRRAWRARARTAHPDVGGDETAMQALNAAYDVCCRFVEQRDAVRHDEVEPSSRDAPSFVVEALPVVAFEALLVATSWMGEVLVDEPPYLLEVHLDDPARCWCRLELVPDAGSTTVSLTLATVDGAPVPPVTMDRRPQRAAAARLSRSRTATPSPVAEGITTTRSVARR
jgi:hypothetical protein